MEKFTRIENEQKNLRKKPWNVTKIKKWKPRKNTSQVKGNTKEK